MWVCGVVYEWAHAHKHTQQRIHSVHQRIHENTYTNKHTTHTRARAEREREREGERERDAHLELKHVSVGKSYVRLNIQLHLRECACGVSSGGALI